MAFKIFGLDAPRCAAVVLDGETSPNFVNLITEDMPTQEFCDADQLKFPLLHKAAFSGSPKLTKLFLERFGDEIVNLRWDSNGIFYPSVTGNMLPLNMTLEALGSGHEPKESVFKIIYRLMDSYYRYHLENLRLLVQRTNNVEKEFCYYVKEGKLSAVTDLLLVAPEKFLPSSVNNQEFDSDRSINVREFVLDEVASMTILNMINTHVEATLESVMKLQVKKLEMEAMLQLIEVFERMGETLAAYLRMQQPNFRKFTI